MVPLPTQEVEQLAKLAQEQFERGELDSAIATLQSVIARAPHSAEAHFRLGVAFRTQTRLAAARDAFRTAFNIDPEYPRVYASLIQILALTGELEEALVHIGKAIERRPRCERFYNDAGGALFTLGKFEEAARAFERAAELNPGWSIPLHNWAKAAFAMEDREGGIELLRRSAEIGNPAHMSHLELALELLRKGEFEQGWRHYEWRWPQAGGKPMHLSEMQVPLWDGSPLGNRTLFLWAEQGYGDILQFVRFADLVPKERGRVILRVPERLRSLVATHRAIDEVVSEGDSVDIDVQFPLLSIPALFGAVPQPIPPYLSAPAQCPEAEAAIGGDTAFHVGIVWASGRGFPFHALRDCPFDLFVPLSAIPSVRLFSLQYHDQENELLTCSAPIVDLTPLLGDFHQTAAFLKRLDLVITVDTSMPHLAGALGVPVWLLASRQADWRWMVDRDDSPWYATMRIYRQGPTSDWGEVMERVARDLREEIARRGRN